MTDENSLLEYYREHRAEIDVLGSEKALVMLFYVRRFAPHTLQELAQGLGWSNEEVQEVSTLLHRTRMIEITNRDQLMSADVRITKAGTNLLDLFSDMTKPKIRVFIADDNLVVREGLRRILESSEDIEVVGETDSPSEILNLVRTLASRVLILDLRWYGDDTAGSRVIEALKRNASDVKVIAVTAYEDLAPSARRAGAEAILPKGFTRDELMLTIRAMSEPSSLSQIG